MLVKGSTGIIGWDYWDFWDVPPDLEHRKYNGMKNVAAIRDNDMWRKTVSEVLTCSGLTCWNPINRKDQDYAYQWVDLNTEYIIKERWLETFVNTFSIILKFSEILCEMPDIIKNIITPICGQAGISGTTLFAGTHMGTRCQWISYLLLSDITYNICWCLHGERVSLDRLYSTIRDDTICWYSHGDLSWYAVSDLT